MLPLRHLCCPKKYEVAYIVQSLKFKDRSSKSEGRGLSEVYPKSKIQVSSSKFDVRILMSEVRSLSEVLNLKCEIQSQKSKIRSLAGVQSLK